MGIMYCIYKNGIGYTGQALRAGETGLGRIIEHINIAYGLYDMPQVFKERIFNAHSDSEGLMNLISQNGASNCSIRYNTNPASCYGVGKTFFDEFSKHWYSKYGEERAKMDFAEFCYIWSWRNTYARHNTQVGGQRSFYFKKRAFLEKIGKIITDEKSPFKTSIEKGLKKVTEKPFSWSGNRDFSEDRNALDSVYMFFWPEQIIFEESLNQFLYNFTTSSKEISKKLTNIIIEQKNAQSKTNKKYTIRDIKQLQNVLNGIVGEILSNSFSKLADEIAVMINQELQETLKTWNEILKNFNLKMYLNNKNFEAVKQNINEQLNIKSGNLQKIIDRVASINWFALNLFTIKPINNKKYPEWLPKNLKLSNLNQNDTTFIKQYYIDSFKAWCLSGASFSEILRKYTKPSILTNNWSVYYNGMMNAWQAANPIVPIRQTTEKQFFKRLNWSRLSSVKLEYWPTLLSADGSLW